VKLKFVFLGAVLTGCVMLPLLLGVSGFFLYLVSLTCIYTLLALSLHIVAGLSGQFSLGHAAFMGLGAYTSAIVTLRLGLPFCLGILCAMAFCGILGIIMGISCLKVRGVYLALVTLGFGVILQSLCMNLTGLTGGGLGILDISAPSFGPVILSTEARVFTLLVVITYMSICLVYNIRKSRMGRAFIAIRQNEISAAAMGVNISKYKVIAFLLSGLLGGLAGGLFAHLAGYIDPGIFSLETSLLIFCMVIIGGMGSVSGAVIGSVLLSFLPEIVRGLAEYRMLVYSVLLVALIIFMPSGIMGLVRYFFGFLNRSRRKKTDKINVRGVA